MFKKYTIPKPFCVGMEIKIVLLFMLRHIFNNVLEKSLAFK